MSFRLAIVSKAEPGIFVIPSSQSHFADELHENPVADASILLVECCVLVLLELLFFSANTLHSQLQNESKSLSKHAEKGSPAHKK